jgi:predicted metalloenzyme YecM
MFHDIQEFLERIFINLENTGIDVRDYRLDHVCYRVSSLEEYTGVKAALEQIARLLHETEIGGRSISTFKLYEPIEYKTRVISCIELPAPKTGKLTVTGWEHVEFVIDKSFEEFMKSYPRVHFDTSGIAKSHNPEIEVEFERCAVKFHHVALEELIESERKQ